VTHTELKIDGINVIEDGADQSTSNMEGREEHALANLLDEKMDDLGEDYAFSLDRLIHGDGSTDAKALAGIRSIILDSPAVGSTGNISRVAFSPWRNRAATTAYGGAGGQGAITRQHRQRRRADRVHGKGMAAAFEVPEGHHPLQDLCGLRLDRRPTARKCGRTASTP
jgi:hypothetical protein